MYSRSYDVYILRWYFCPLKIVFRLFRWNLLLALRCVLSLPLFPSFSFQISRMCFLLCWKGFFPTVFFLWIIFKKKKPIVQKCWITGIQYFRAFRKIRSLFFVPLFTFSGSPEHLMIMILFFWYSWTNTTASQIWNSFHMNSIQTYLNVVCS